MASRMLASPGRWCFVTLSFLYVSGGHEWLAGYYNVTKLSYKYLSRGEGTKNNLLASLSLNIDSFFKTFSLPARNAMAVN